MTRQLFLSFILGLLIFSSSCKKEDEETTATKLQHRWTVNSFTENERIDGEDNMATRPAGASDYMEFTSAGTVNLRLESTDFSLPYSVTAENKLLLGAQSFDIQTLNNNTFVIYSKEMQDVNNYSEVTINMRR